MKLVIAKLGFVYVCLTVISLLLFTSASYAEINPESVVAMWLFEEGSGKSAKDTSGNGNDADITKGSYVDGKFGKALSFGGDGFAESKTFSNVDGRFSSAHTYMLWAKEDGTGSEIPFNAGSARVMNIHFNESPGSLLVGFSGMAGDWIRMPGVWISGEWHHVAVTYDGNSMIAYLDAKKVGDRANPGKPPAESGSYMIGRFLGGGYFYKGLIDEIVVFDVALEPKDIADIVNRGMEAVLGGNDVSATSKLAATWASIKTQ
jgi:hypothetical protein